MANMNKALGTDLAALAQILRSKGRGKDSVLAHITPKEAALLKRKGGRGSINPDTGLPEFDDEEGGYDPAPVEQAPVEQVAAPVDNYYQSYSPETPVSQEQQVQPMPQTAGFDPFTYGAASGEQVYRGEAGVPTPSYAAPGAGSAAFGATGGALVDTNKPGAATLLDSGGAETSVRTDTGETGGAGKPSGISDLLKSLGISGGTAAKLGLAGALGAYGASQARKASSQTQAATQEQKAIAQPYTEQGKQLIAQAQAGQLTPSGQQALEAAKAQLAQSQSNRGGVGAQQSANQIANIYQTLLDNQYKYGLQVMQIGDNISLGAIKSGLQLDQQLQQTTNNFYSQLASIVGGQPIRVS